MNFNNAFVQADLKDPVWVHLPREYKSRTTTPTCLRLKKSLYGLSIAPKLWCQYLTKGLIEDNFQQSAHVECLFFKSNMIIFLYVDDCGIASPEMSEIDAFIDRLKNKGFELTKECDFHAYLGIKFQRNSKTNSKIVCQFRKLYALNLLTWLPRQIGNMAHHTNRLPRWFQFVRVWVLNHTEPYSGCVSIACLYMSLSWECNM